MMRGGRGARRFARRFPGMAPMAAGFARRMWLRQNPLAAEVQQRLAHANQLMAAGKAAEAAVIFENVQTMAEQNNMPGRAAHLAMRTAFAYLKSGDTDKAIEYARRGIQGSLALGDGFHATQAANRFLSELSTRGGSDKVAALRQEFIAMFAQAGLTLSAAPNASQPTPRLPTQCPACLGPVRSDEVEWIDDHSAACAFCGTVLQAQ